MTKNCILVVGVDLFKHIYINHSGIQIPNQKPQVNSKPNTKITQKKPTVIGIPSLDKRNTKFINHQPKRPAKPQTNDG